MAWSERRYLLRLALFPLIMKVMFFGLVMIFEAENHVLRQTLIMLPAYFVEGWMVAHIVRLVFFEERWPIRLSGESQRDVPYLINRGRALFAGIILYVLIKMLLAALAAVAIQNQAVFRDISQQSEVPFSLFLLSTMMLVGMVWFFKHAFVYIPVMADFSVKGYLRKFSGLAMSVQFIGVWLVCYIPLALLGGLCLGVLGKVVAVGGTGGVFLLLAVQLVTDFAALSVATICFSLIIRNAFYQP